jgi:hypothetical protein
MEPEPRIITVQGFIRKTGVVRAHQRNARGRPRVADSRTQVTFLIPDDVYDRVCRIALKRDRSLASVLREVIVKVFQTKSTPETTV